MVVCINDNIQTRRSMFLQASVRTMVKKLKFATYKRVKLMFWVKIGCFRKIQKDFITKEKHQPRQRQKRLILLLPQESEIVYKWRPGTKASPKKEKKGDNDKGT